MRRFRSSYAWAKYLQGLCSPFIRFAVSSASVSRQWRRADNKQWKRKDKKRPCIAKRTISSKKMLYAIFFNSSGPVIQVPCPLVIQSLAYSIRILYWRKWKSFTRNDQAKDGQESTFYMTLPPLISVRSLSLFWLLKSFKPSTLFTWPEPVTSFYFQDLRKCFLEISIRLEVLLAALFISVSNRYQKKTVHCFSRLDKKVTKMCFSKGGILWRFVIKICLIKRSTEVIRTQWQNVLQDLRIT